MAGGISDIYFTSLRLAKGESVAEASPAPLVRVPGAGTVVSDQQSGGQAVVDALTAGLLARLTRFSSTLSRFSWPSDAASPWRARLVVKDSGLENALAAKTADSGTAVNPFKFFSSGKSAIAPSGVDAGEYALTVTQGGSQATAAVSVGAHDTWGMVLGKVAAAINGLDTLSVRADVTRQQKPFTLDPMLAATGSVLAVSVNPLRREQDVTLADKHGNLLAQLGLQSASTPDTPATPAVYNIAVNRLASPTFLHTTAFDPGAATTLATGLHTFSLATGTGAQPTSYVSSALDPEAATTLAPGTYTFGVRVGEVSREFSVTVKAGWTWNAVQNAVAGQINAQPGTAWAADGVSTELVSAPSFSLPGVTASSKTVAVPASGGGTTAGQVLTVRTASGYDGEALVLTDGAGGILRALGLTAPLRGQVVSVPVAAGDTWGDVLGTVSRVVRLSTGRVAAQSRDTTVAATSVPGKTLSMQAAVAELTLLNRKLNDSLTLTDGASGLLSSLGLDVKLPGQNGEITVNGRAMSSENNTYALQSGRLRLDALDATGEALPLVVTQSMDRLETRLGDVLGAYNDLRKYIGQNSDALDASLGTRLGQPVTDNWPGLATLGFARSGKSDLLWISADAFWRGVYTDAAGAGETLATRSASLMPAWKDVVAGILAAGADSFLLPETGHLSRVAVRRTAADLERTNWLVDRLG